MSNKIIGYQIESRDGKHEIPENLWSFEVFKTAKLAAAHIKKEKNPKKWAIIPVFDGDIEAFNFIK